MFSAECSRQVSGVPQGPTGLVVEMYEKLEDIHEDIVTEMGSLKGGTEVARDTFRWWFDNGGVVWLARVNGATAGYLWGVPGGWNGYYYGPMSPKDVALVNQETLPAFRGQAVAPALLDHTLRILSQRGFQRIFCAVRSWNKAGIRNVEKARFERLNTFRERTLFGFSVIIWRLERKKRADEGAGSR